MRARLLILFVALLANAALANEFLTEGGNIAIDVHPRQGRIAIDLNGELWLLDDRGGEAQRLDEESAEIRRPKWSPDGQSILFISETADGGSLRIRSLAGDSSHSVGDGTVHNQDASWHPDGQRIVYVSDRHDAGLDVWETDLPTGLSWRLTSGPGDEFSPAWSANGRHLAWIQHDEAGFAIMLRLFGRPETELMRSADRISSLAWRPDGSMLTFLHHRENETTLDMAILSEPLLVRTLVAGEEFVDAPVTWSDRMTLFYTADGRIRTRGFEDRVSRPVHFRAMVAPFVPPPPPKPIPQRQLEVSHPPDGRLIIRSARLFDGIWQGYRSTMDVVIDGGRIEAIEPSRQRQDGVLLDLGDITVIPGLIDAGSPAPESAANGTAILAYGVTTVVVDGLADGFDPVSWESEQNPGPRIIVSTPDDVSIEITGLADGGLDDIDDVIGSRQARALRQTTRPVRRFGSMRDVADVASTVVAGSRPNRLPPGIGLHAELHALQQSGLTGEQVLHAAGRNPARALGAENQIGTLTPGALADLVLISGDPLTDVGEALNIVAVVRNGRFFSLVSLLERAEAASIVE